MLNTKKIMISIGVILLLLFILTACKSSIETNRVKEPETINETQKDFTLLDVNGDEYTLSNNSGKRVYIKFWATWCSICLSGLEEINMLSEAKMYDESVQIITIVSPGVKSEMKSEKFVEWFKNRGYTFSVLLDEDGIVTRDYAVRGYPTSFFIDEKGNIIKSQPGHVSNEEINDVLDKIM